MGIFDKLKESIFGHHNAGSAAPAAPASAGIVSGGSSTAPPAPAAAPTPSAPAATMPTVDVAAMLDAKAAKTGHKVNWRESIVDLMSLVGIDNSLAERRALARELGYTGDLNDTAPMNIWLHKQVMRKLAENGGKVPPELLD
ncbi:MAG TPA: DUF3597 domain-containing protein [Gemmatimonadaceae bacterium]|nr:DUF3597 domain-containing protein [Gemmatimonadaceae bacterium]